VGLRPLRDASTGDSRVKAVLRYPNLSVSLLETTLARLRGLRRTVSVQTQRIAVSRLSSRRDLSPDTLPVLLVQPYSTMLDDHQGDFERKSPARPRESPQGSTVGLLLRRRRGPPDSRSHQPPRSTQSGSHTDCSRRRQGRTTDVASSRSSNNSRRTTWFLYVAAIGAFFASVVANNSALSSPVSLRVSVVVG